MENPTPPLDAPTAEQLQEAVEFSDRLYQIYRFLRFGGNLEGSLITALANHHANRSYTIEGFARKLRRQAQQIATQQEVRGGQICVE